MSKINITDRKWTKMPAMPSIFRARKLSSGRRSLRKMFRLLKVSEIFQNIRNNISNISDIRAESQKLRSTVSSVCNQGVTEIKQHWMSTNNVSSVLHSHWSRLNEARLSLVESFIVLLRQCLLCHKEPARRIQSPLLGATGWFFMA